MKATARENFTSQAVPAALTASRVVLRILLIVNWVYGAAILTLLVASVTNEIPVMTAIGVPPSPATQALIKGMQAIALLGLVSVPVHYLILRRLLDIVESVRARDPFIGQNASRLQAIAWGLVGLQALSLVIGLVAHGVSTRAHPFHVNAGFSTAGWLAVLLLFVLARVFAEGARMRDELEGTV